MTTALLGADEIRDRLAARESARVAVERSAYESKYRYVRPFGLAADGLIETALNAEGRFMFGLTDIDLMTRGIGKGELAYVIGRAHGGKTQVVLNAVRHNPDKRILWFTPDEVSELVLSKLVAMTHGIDAETVEAQIKAGDQRIIDIVKRTAYSTYSNLIVVDDSLTLGQMDAAFKEAEDYWQAPCDAVVVDFLELIPGDDGADGVVAKSQGLKRWTKARQVPVVCLHQTAKSLAPRGQAGGMDGMRYGGDTEAIFVFEVYRKRDDKEMDEWDRTHHANTITVAVHKNKRPPCKKGEHDYWLDPQTGLIRAITDADRVSQMGGTSTDAAVVLQARRDQLADAQLSIVDELSQEAEILGL